MKSLTKVLSLGLTVAAVSGVQAQLLIPGGTAFNPGIDNQATLTANYPTGGSPDLQSYTSGTLSGGVVSAVITGDAANPHGGLTFLYEILNSGLDAVSALSIPTFTGATVTVRENSSSGGVTPVAALRDASGSPVSFFFNSSTAPFTSIPSGGNSSFLLIHTDAAAFTTGSATVVGDTGFASVNVFMPVPEPAAYATVCGLGLLGLAAWRRRNLAS